MYEYFHISAADLGKDAKVPVLKLGDSGEVFYEIAMEMVNTIKANNAAGKHTVFICPVGPVGQYPSSCGWSTVTASASRTAGSSTWTSTSPTRASGWKRATP